MVITIIIAIVHQHATKDSQQPLIFRISILGEGFNVFSYYLSPSCQVNCIPALIWKTKRPGQESTTKQIKQLEQDEHSAETVHHHITEEHSRKRLKFEDAEDVSRNSAGHVLTGFLGETEALQNGQRTALKCFQEVNVSDPFRPFTGSI